MLPQFSIQSNLTSFSNKVDKKSPYLLQYKVFEQRLKRQQKQMKGLSFVNKNKAISNKEDYLQITKSILSKKQNFNILEGLPSITIPINQCPNISRQIVQKTRKIFENSKQKSKINKSHRETLASLKQNSYYEGSSRIKSESNTHCMRDRTNSGVSFIGYKRGRKCMEGGLKRIWGII